MTGPYVESLEKALERDEAIIEKQRAEVERLRAILNESGDRFTSLCEEIDHLNEEIERLRVALRQIAELPRVDGNDPFEVNRRGQELRLNEQARDIARRALEPKP